MDLKNKKIGVIGLGYVGLPLAVEFARKYKVIGYDIDNVRIKNLRDCFDETHEVDSKLLGSVLDDVNLKPFGLSLTSTTNPLSECNVYIITVPTPIDRYNRPNLVPMIKASEMIAGFLKKGDIVVYESTVYPGTTEEEMVPILERVSGLKFNHDFYSCWRFINSLNDS